MRIALFTETFLPKIDGVVNTLCHLLDHLKARGHESQLFAPAGGPDAYADTEVVGLKGMRFPWYRELTVLSPWARVGPQLEAFEPDLVHVLNPFFLGVAGLRWAARHDVPVVASYHTDVPGYLRRYGYGFLARPTWRYLRWLHDRAALNLCPSSVTLAELHREGFRNLELWTRGVDTEAFAPERRSDAWRQRLTNGDPEAPLLLYVGRLAPEKRVSWLRPMMEAVPGARLAIVGGGPSQLELERELSDTRTVFAGYLRGESLAAAYASADLFVFPSANETFGNVLLEAAASGLPSVAPRSGGVVDIVDDGETGRLVDPDDVKAFTSTVSTLVRDRAAARRMGEMARRRARERTWPAVLDGLLESYASRLRRAADRAHSSAAVLPSIC